MVPQRDSVVALPTPSAPFWSESLVRVTRGLIAVVLALAVAIPVTRARREQA